MATGAEYQRRVRGFRVLATICSSLAGARLVTSAGLREERSVPSLSEPSDGNIESESALSDGSSGSAGGLDSVSRTSSAATESAFAGLGSK